VKKPTYIFLLDMDNHASARFPEASDTVFKAMKTCGAVAADSARILFSAPPTKGQQGSREE